ncbi:MFS transporter [Halomicrobium salinisoli]|uniref:MFS transporter n=1 Tax=Halomicrobium salinisoli TaxID=2878391 RepID=UPI001CF04A2C|nr:MFS transporter [Halomicrobium salinisoli]
MASALRSELEERLSLRSIAFWLVFLAGFRVVFDASVPQLAWLTTTAVVGGLAEIAVDAYGVRDDVRHLGFALTALVGGGALLVLDGGPAWVSAGLLVAGLWVCLDVVQTLRHEGVTVDDEPRDGHEVYRDYVARCVRRALRKRPRTRRELVDDLAADAADVDAALDRLADEGAIERRGSELRVVESTEPTGLAAVADRLRSVARRLARPVALEFRSL